MVGDRSTRIVPRRAVRLLIDFGHASIDPSAEDCSRLRWGARLSAPFLLALFLLFLNDSGTVAGLLFPPPGYVSNLVPRSTDMCQYVTWMHAFQKATVIPDYHAPWLTKPALFNPALWLIARVAYSLHINVKVAYLLFQLLIYLLAAYALFFAIRSFTNTAAQSGASLVAAWLAVPVQALLTLPFLLLPARLRSSLPELPGIGDFVWMSSDGFFHGIGVSALVTIGTATVLLAFGLLARYFNTEKRRYLWLAAMVTCISAFLHPFEVCIIASAGILALLLRNPANRRRAFADALLLGAAGAIGILPYAFMTVRHPWLHAAGKIPSWVPYAPPRLLLMLGLPMMVALALWLRKPRVPSGTDLLVSLWVACTLFSLYLPGLPDVQHFLDGFHYAGALLLVRLAVLDSLYAQIRRACPRTAIAALAVLCVFSTAPYLIYSWQAFVDGRTRIPGRLASEVISAEEAATVAWMQQHARPDDLVLAPTRMAPLLATPPMHSLASHQIFSLTYDRQVHFSDAFFAGTLDPRDARNTLEGYGVRFLVMPIWAKARPYINDAVRRSQIGSLVIFEFPHHHMKDYSGVRPR